MKTQVSPRIARFTNKIVGTANDLKSNGYARFGTNGRDLKLQSSQIAAFSRNAIKHLPPDPYSKGDRNRRHGVYVYLPDDGVMVPIDRLHDGDQVWSAYHQGSRYNPEMGGVHRRFPALTEAQVQSPVLRAIIKQFFSIARLAGVLPPSPAFMVGVHINQQAPKGSLPASVVPPWIHIDGEPVTFAFLLGRANVSGGWTAVAHTDHVGKHPDNVEPDGILARFTLDEPGQCYVVDDCKVAHHAEAVTAINPAVWSHRTMLLVDFRPMQELYTHDMSARR